MQASNNKGSPSRPAVRFTSQLQQQHTNGRTVADGDAARHGWPVSASRLQLPGRDNNCYLGAGRRQRRAASKAGRRRVSGRGGRELGRGRVSVRVMRGVNSEQTSGGFEDSFGFANFTSSAGCWFLWRRPPIAWHLLMKSRGPA